MYLINGETQGAFQRRDPWGSVLPARSSPWGWLEAGGSPQAAWGPRPTSTAPRKPRSLPLTCRVRRGGPDWPADAPGSGQLPRGRVSPGGGHRAGGREGGTGWGCRIPEGPRPPPTSAQLPPRQAGGLKSNQTRKRLVQLGGAGVGGAGLGLELPKQPGGAGEATADQPLSPRLGLEGTPKSAPG